MNSLIAIAGRDFTDDFAKLVGNPELLQQTLEFVKDPKVVKGSLEQEAYHSKQILTIVVII
ncbi:hypothetical protein [Bartonella jaculi]|uniref:Uncharacterized protein n=1 Tax=Bartonella jaculi TaxID=686226 RepID=A0ABP9N791_9HYPH